ncbi:MAG: hypothetical protein ACRESR_10010 [Gammaproteobacteria bacterium]
MRSVSIAQLKHYYKWRHKMDWLLAPIHTRSDLKRYLKEHAKSGSPLDALPPDARNRVLSEVQFGPHGPFIANFGDLQYLSTQQAYKILALFGEQSRALEFTGGKIRPASPRAAPGSVRPSLISNHFDEFDRTCRPGDDETGSQRRKCVVRAYDRLFASLQNEAFVQKVGSHDLRLMFRAAARVAVFTFNPRYAQDAELDFSEMETRHFAGPPDYSKMYEVLVHTRQFAAAHKFYEVHPDADLTPFPHYRDEAGKIGRGTPTILAVSTTKDELIRRRVNLRKPAQVLILTDPYCHFCTDFDRSLKSLPKLRAALAHHTFWVTPPGSELEFDTLQQWNKTHPGMRLSIMYSLQGWPMVKTLAVPQFFFLQSGKLKAHEMGWDKDSLSQIESGLKTIGLWK